MWVCMCPKERVRGWENVGICVDAYPCIYAPVYVCIYTYYWWTPACSKLYVINNNVCIYVYILWEREKPKERKNERERYSNVQKKKELQRFKAAKTCCLVINIYVYLKKTMNSSQHCDLQFW